MSSIAASKTCSSIKARALSIVAVAVTDSHPRSASMSSIIMRISISSSTTRTLRPTSKAPIARRGCGNTHGGDQSFCPVLEINGTRQFVSQAALDHARAESSAQWRRHRRTTLLPPMQDQSGAIRTGLDLPLDVDGSRCVGKRAVFDGIARKFVERDSERQGGFGRKAGVLDRKSVV